ncbi:MAG TPA: hypothetical protein VJ965_06810 [Anaerolineales bacterium]|nr:hypothetical protein [Anaerolineales bacterium]
MQKFWPFFAAGLLLVVAALLMIPQTGQAIYALLGIDTAGTVSLTSDFDAFVPLTSGYFPEDFTIKHVSSGAHTAPGLDRYSEVYASDTHFFKLIESQGEDAPALVPDPDFTIQQTPASLTDAVGDLAALLNGDPDPAQFDSSQVWTLTVELREVTVQVVSNLPRQEVIAVAEGLVPAYCTGTPTPDGQ